MHACASNWTTTLYRHAPLSGLSELPESSAAAQLYDELASCTWYSMAEDLHALPEINLLYLLSVIQVKMPAVSSEPSILEHLYS